MSYLLLVQNELENVKLIIRIRQSELVEKQNILYDLKGKVPQQGFWCLSDKELKEHLANLESELNKLVNRVNIDQVYEI